MGPTHLGAITLCPWIVCCNVKRTVLVVTVLVAILGVQATSAVSIGTSQQSHESVQLHEGSVSGISVDKEEFLIDTTVGSADGVPVAARVTYGSPSNPTENPAFSITSTEKSSQQVNFRYTGVSDDNTVSNVKFIVYGATGSQLTDFSEESRSDTITLEPDQTLNVVVVIDTEGLTKGTSLSGSFEVSTSPIV